jgi:peptidoglycan/xylan/chitin deacetylase (PgdA/CDA1 family)
MRSTRERKSLWRFDVMRVVVRMGQALSKRRLASAFLGSRLAQRMWARPVSCDTVRILAYHRVLDAPKRGFPFDHDLISASSALFRDQLHFVRDHFNVISFEDLARCEDAGQPWPERGVIITFDDGYRDNFSHAYPILREMKFPATIFLATGHVGQSSLFWWDLVVYCMKRTAQTSVKFDEIAGVPMSLRTRRKRRIAVQNILTWLKSVPEEAKGAFLARYAAKLGVSVPEDVADGMHLSWDEVREMAANGISFGSHTVTHPILARVTPEQLTNEVVESKRTLERELGKPAMAFSYPVGDSPNFNQMVEKCVADAGFRYAVSYEEGIADANLSDRYALPRLHVETHDTIHEFKAKLMYPGLLLSRV